ncbi:MAG: CheR family methyltransferase [Stenomitos frigidus ULC029]
MDNSGDDQAFVALLDYLKQVRSFDFSGYKRSSFQRRVEKQMKRRDVATFEDYIDYLEVHPDEFASLFNTVLINVTGFFRDAEAWSYLQANVLPALLESKPPDEPIRVWSAGCASGEEAYTLAIVLTEILGASAFRQRVKIYATDVDEEALSQARHASYSLQDLQAVSPELQERYFEPIADRYIFRADLRRVVIFGRHDLVQDAPISRLDLLVCRNTLMYFNAEMQARILSRLHFSLSKAGILFLGKAEMLPTHTSLFTPLNLSHRMFAKVPKVNLRDRPDKDGSSEGEADSLSAANIRLWKLVFSLTPVSQVVIDRDGRLVQASNLAKWLFGIKPTDIGNLLQDLELSYRPLELRSHIEQAYSNGRSLTVNSIARYLPDGMVQYLDVQFIPLQEGTERLGISIVFTDVSRYHELQIELQRSSQALETANEELQSSNEELQSTNEELETTNEELQSTNEELETMNEELQSTNEELQAMNDELRQRTDEANQASAFLQSILASIQAGVVVMDNQFNLLSWNQQTENLWGLRSEEVAGQSFFNLEIGLPVDQLRETIRRCIAGADQLELTIPAINRRGRSFDCRILCNPLIGAEQERQGVILIMEEVEA